MCPPLELFRDIALPTFQSDVTIAPIGYCLIAAAPDS